MSKPNIIFILADDMGYGDAHCNNPDSRIPTPHLDRLAEKGMCFSDAHAGSSVCTPSRYSILTGRYAWRSRLKKGIVWQWDAPLIEPERLTVAGMLRDNGYRTACLGKWHLGWDWQTLDGRRPNDTLTFGEHELAKRAAFGENIDYRKRIGGGPVDRGFDSYFGVDVPNFPPYAWFEDDHLTALPTQDKPNNLYGAPGKAVPGWELERMIPEFTRRAVEFIETHGERERKTENTPPYFLYYPLTSPHSPVVPNADFRGRSGIGLYGDFVCEVDWVVGQIMGALDRTGTFDNTLLVFTSDNGPENRTGDDEGVYERARRAGHYSMGDLRGIKRDAWEGGHRVPFVASWPAVIPEGQRCDQVIGLCDFMATAADTIGIDLPEGAGEDSVSYLPLLKGRVDRPIRTSLVHHSAAGRFALRRGEWVFIDGPTGDENGEPEWLKEKRGYSPHDEPGELFNLEADLSESANRYGEHPGIVSEMSRALNEMKGGAQPPARSGASAASLSE